ncbi:MAG: hypothetical protein QCI38_06130, partial [Candidatus Thermoplasmatota archaeon]|nr:hypothetical protein [Candidatus Thermoplasmatota archaeon]
SDVELGDLELVEMEQFKHVFQIKENPVASLYPEIENKKTCYVTADALSQFYSKDMSLVNTCEELECINGGSDHCVFEINLQPLSVYQVVLDRSDRKMVEVMSKMESPGVEQMADELLLEPEEVEYRLDILRRYHLCTDDNRLTKIGMTYSKYGTGPLSEKEEEFSPPWDDISAVAASVAGAGSFAEAFKETAEAEPIWEVDEKQIINLAEEAKKSKSFAELLSRHLNKDDEEGGN